MNSDAAGASLGWQPELLAQPSHLPHCVPSIGLLLTSLSGARFFCEVCAANFRGTSCRKHAWAGIAATLRGSTRLYALPEHSFWADYPDFGKVQPRTVPVFSKRFAIFLSSFATLFVPLSETAILTTRATASRVSFVFSCLRSHLRTVTTGLPSRSDSDPSG